MSSSRARKGYNSRIQEQGEETANSAMVTVGAIVVKANSLGHLTASSSNAAATQPGLGNSNILNPPKSYNSHQQRGQLQVIETTEL